MNSQLKHSGTKSTSSIRGFIPFLAIALWFLLAIMSARPAAAADGSYITAQDIVPDIEAALSAKGMPADAIVEIDDATRAISADFSIMNTSYNPLSGRFVVRLAQSGAITGFAKAIRNTPVLSANIQRGDLITEADVTYREVSATRGNHFITDANDLIGMTARRPLAAHTPIRTSDVEAPILVSRGAIVTLSYSMSGLRMTHQGVAADSGAKGDVISVRNLSSDRTLKGVITDRNFITIVPRGGIVEG